MPSRQPKPPFKMEDFEPIVVTNSEGEPETMYRLSFEAFGSHINTAQTKGFKFYALKRRDAVTGKEFDAIVYGHSMWFDDPRDFSLKLEGYYVGDEAPPVDKNTLRFGRVALWHNPDDLSVQIGLSPKGASQVSWSPAEHYVVRLEVDTTRKVITSGLFTEAELGYYTLDRAMATIPKKAELAQPVDYASFIRSLEKDLSKKPRR